MIPDDPIRRYRLHEEQLARQAELRRRQKAFLAERAAERRAERLSARAEHVRRRTAGRTVGGMLALLLPARRG